MDVNEMSNDDAELENVRTGRWLLATGEELEPEVFPDLGSISAAFLYSFLPIPTQPLPSEYVWVVDGAKPRRSSAAMAAIAWWNMTWEAAHLRSDVVDRRLRRTLSRAFSYQTRGRDLTFLLSLPGMKYPGYVPLYHLLPLRTLKAHGLPPIRRATWPPNLILGGLDALLPTNVDGRLSRAFAEHVWPLLCRQSGISAFSSGEPLRLLAHNLDFWLPYADRVVRRRFRALGSVPLEEGQEEKLERLRAQLPSDVMATRPSFGGHAWMGEDEAWDATVEIVDEADQGGRLRGLIDAIRSHRVEDDFSSRWSFAREDFERKLHHKRMKTRVRFVELADTIPVHGPDSEVHENLLWEDFFAVLDAKEREIVVCLRNGHTVGDIAADFGYANHSPVSKRLSAIRRKAALLLGIDGSNN